MYRFATVFSLVRVGMSAPATPAVAPSDDALAIDPMNIRDIKVERTITGGQKAYLRP